MGSSALFPVVFLHQVNDRSTEPTHAADAFVEECGRLIGRAGLYGVRRAFAQRSRTWISLKKASSLLQRGHVALAFGAFAHSFSPPSTSSRALRLLPLEG